MAWHPQAMRLSEALSPSTWLEVPFAGGGVLKVKYRPSHATIAELQSMMNGTEEEQVTRVIQQIIDIVEDWDLTEEDNETKVAIEFERLRHIPTNIFREVLVAVRKHQSAGEVESSSDAG
jgi:uncharacterized protein YqgV (UPF0045/DUF77 family)